MSDKSDRSDKAAAHRAPEAAMTLMEILMVMAIMTLIVSAVVAASFAAQRRAQVKGTEGLFEQIAVGLAQYKADHRMYVPSDPSDLPDNTTYPLWQALEGTYIDVKARHKHKPEKDSTYTDPRTGVAVQRYRYQDAWKKALWYGCAAPYDRFEIRSSGPDLEAETGDDISRRQ